jgi:hypothetical protein
LLLVLLLLLLRQLLSGMYMGSGPTLLIGTLF